MIISPAQKYIFVHIPKTGGTSLAAALEERSKRGDILIGDTPKAKKRRPRVKKLQEKAKGRLWKHSTIQDIDGVVDDDDLDDYFCFTMVRNPWDRLVSYYNWLRMQKFDHAAVRIAQMSTFDLFLQNLQIQQSIRMTPYSSYMMDWMGYERCRLYIRLEQWRPDMERLIDHVGYVPGLDHLNRSHRHPDYRTYYTDESAELVGQLCQRDISQFGYRF